VESCSDAGSSLTNIYGYSTASDTSGTWYKTFSPSNLTENSFGIYVGGDGYSTSGHGVDNYNGVDAIMFKFADLVRLTELKAGWIGSDNPANFSLLAYMPTGSQPTIPTVDGMSLSTPDVNGKLSNGWQLVGNFGFTSTSSTLGVATSTAYYSSYWLVAAYNTYYGGTDTNTAIADQFKLLTVAGTKQDTPPGNKVPEPGSLVLLGAGLFGMMASRRRRSNQSEN
jgi:hypothetical protein